MTASTLMNGYYGYYGNFWVFSHTGRPWTKNPKCCRSCRSCRSCRTSVSRLRLPHGEGAGGMDPSRPPVSAPRRSNQGAPHPPHPTRHHGVPGECVGWLTPHPDPYPSPVAWSPLQLNLGGLRLTQYVAQIGLSRSPVVDGVVYQTYEPPITLGVMASTCLTI